MSYSQEEKKEIAKRVLLVRQALRMTQSQLATSIGAKLPTVKNYEAGTRVPSGRLLGGFARIGVNVDWLLNGGEGPMLMGPKNRTFWPPDVPPAALEAGSDYSVSAEISDTRVIRWVIEELSVHHIGMTPKQIASVISGILHIVSKAPEIRRKEAIREMALIIAETVTKL